MKRIAAALAVAGLAAAAIIMAAQVSASAHDHRVPKTALLEGKQGLQTGRPIIEYSWTRPAGDGICVAETAILESRFPTADTVAAGSKLRVRIFKNQRPRSFTIKRVDRNGVPVQQIKVRLRPVVRSGQRVAWDALFRVTRPGTDYRLVSEGHWRDREGCRADQYAFWSFYVKTSGTY